MKKFVILLFFLLSNSAVADSINSSDEAKAITSKIVQHFLKAEFNKGLNIAKKYWPLPTVEIDGLANQINTQWAIVEKRFGRPTGMEYLHQEKIGKSFLRYYYLHKFQNHAIYWEFTFYKPNNKWIINGITFKDDLEILFKEY